MPTLPSEPMTTATAAGSTPGANRE
jgi:hypothetical protein